MPLLKRLFTAVRSVIARALEFGRADRSTAEKDSPVKHRTRPGNAEVASDSATLERVSETLLGLAGRADQQDGLARVLAGILPVYLDGTISGKYFRVWEEHGFHLTPVHFYQPIPDTRSLADDLWATDSKMVGVDLNESAQLELLSNVFPQFRDEYNQIPLTPTEVPHEFFLKNGKFEAIDALVLYCMIRHFRPRQILEVGSGFSSRLSAAAAQRNGSTVLNCIDPFPDPMLVAGFPGLTSVIALNVQDVPLHRFEELIAGDILFVDSSHVVKTGGDVNYLFLEVLPRLRPGVIVHFHDIFVPSEYPKEWMLEHNLFWTEQYLLHAFLIFNSEYEVLFANNYMVTTHQEKLKTVFPNSPWIGGGSFWIRRKLR